jgi:predicted phosphohydrolase
MKLQYASDLHLEFAENKDFLQWDGLYPEADILLLAGDIVPFSRIGQYSGFFDELSANFKTVYWLPGNHEYYHADLAERRGSFNIAIRDNVFLVNDFAVTHGNVRLIFATLWTDVSPRFAFAVERGMNDFELIRFGKDRFTVDQAREEHRTSLAFIEYELAQETSDLQKVVVTHHVPTFQHYPPKYLGSPINQGFATELEQFILNWQPAAWIYGHHHQNIPEFSIGDTRMLTNQLGYVQYGEHKLFDRSKVLEF